MSCAKPAWRRELVALGTATDPYQPIEGHYKLTRQSLEALVRGADAGRAGDEGTDGRARRRRADETRRGAACTVCMSVPSVERGGLAEPRAGDGLALAAAEGGARARRRGGARGRADGAARSGNHDQPPVRRRDRAAIADHGAAFVGANLLYLQGGTRTHFLEFLAREYPDLTAAYDELYAGGSKYAPGAITPRRCRAWCARCERATG